jgi:hypothetical protein
MNIRSLTYKPIVTDEITGEKYYDLSTPIFRYNQTYIVGIYYVTDEDEARPDLISTKYFGSPSYLDAILIFNRIYNPFSLQKGDLLLIPDVTDESSVYQKPPSYNEPNSPLKTFTDTERQSVQDKSRIERLKKNAQGKKNAARNPIPPNMLQPGQSGTEALNGTIILGANMNRREGLT